MSTCRRGLATGVDLKGPPRRLEGSASDTRSVLNQRSMAMDETILDLRGIRCPHVVLRAKKALRTVPVGGVLALECTDPLTVIDVPHFVTQTGHRLDAQERAGDLYIFRITKLR